KDTVAEYMTQFDPSIVTGSFKEPIFHVFRQVIPHDMAMILDELYNTPGWKDTPNEELNGKTPRELMIHISENFIKPFFGETYYGKSLADTIEGFESDFVQCAWVIPDGGFYEEIDEVYKVFGDRVIVVQFTRPGFESFTGDSRNFVRHPGVHTVTETNEDSSEALALRLIEYIDYE
ncbi:MAG: hypothetical protein ACRDCE_00045, partial [Cetobacterium sp.]|uniref:hypothetical protein n=1 Tax=Cetobacterium sp. TaxID=2071632 RepID=UPI003EE5B9FD